MTHKEKYNLMSAGEFLDYLSSFGLRSTVESGGKSIPDSTALITSNSFYNYDLSYKNGDSVMFFDSQFFLKTVELTEQSLKVKLFI